MEPKKLRGSRTTVFDEKGAAGTKHFVSHTMIFNECVSKGAGDRTCFGLNCLSSPLFTAEDDGEVFFQIVFSAHTTNEYKVYFNLKSKPRGTTVHFCSKVQPDMEGPFLKKDDCMPFAVTVPSYLSSYKSYFSAHNVAVKAGDKGFRIDITYLKVGPQVDQQSTSILTNIEKNMPIRCRLGADLLANSSFSDITFKSNEREWKLHKNVLSARSKVFAAMFASDMKENKKGVVEFKDVDSTALDLLIKFIYSDSVDLHDIHQDTAIELLDLGEQYDLPLLKEHCENRLISHLSAENCLRLCALAGKHNCQLLLTPAKSMLADNLANICKSQKDELIDFVREYGDLSVAVFELLKRA